MIGRADLDGKHVERKFIAGASDPDLMAVARGHLYWANQGSNTIARASVNGSAVKQNFVAGAVKPLGVAVSTGHVFWVNGGASSIGRTNLRGNVVDELFIRGVWAAIGLAVDADDRPPQTKIAGRVPKRTHRHSLKFRFRSSEKGSSFSCKIDSKRWKRCAAPEKVKHLKAGRHTFRVRAMDAAGNTDKTPAKSRFKVVG